MRQKVVAGNWKMNTTLDVGVELAKDVVAKSNQNGVEVILIPPLIHLSEVNKILAEEPVALGAQNCHQNDSGAYTGEVSAGMVKSCGATYVLVGHSERREYFHESDNLLAEKVNAVLAAGLTPIFCCGEKLESREAGKQQDIVQDQIQDALFHLTDAELSKIIVAYEPVWAIGTGQTATADQAQEMHAFIRSILGEKYGDVSEQIPILYGGSVKPNNAEEIFAKPDVDGGLIGGASLKAEDFLAIANAF